MWLYFLWYATVKTSLESPAYLGLEQIGCDYIERLWGFDTKGTHLPYEPAE